MEVEAVDYEGYVDPQGYCESLPNSMFERDELWLGEIVEVTYFPDSGAVGSLVSRYINKIITS